MDRFSIALKKKPSKNDLSFFDRMRGLFGTKYPIKVINVPFNPHGRVPYPTNNPFFFYDVAHELFVHGENPEIPYFSYRGHRDEIKTVFRTIEKEHSIKDIMIYRQGQSDDVGIILNLDKERKTAEVDYDSDEADYDARHGYGRSER
jgi:hypothetical protein